jgi:hypothetical protein
MLLKYTTQMKENKNYFYGGHYKYIYILYFVSDMFLLVHFGNINLEILNCQTTQYILRA